ncbi:MAG: OB-fold nucleic acid binding domain-containing protein [Pseudanabaenaceae cyanobacterium]
MKIVKRNLIGYQPVYDIGLARDHNFVLANGTIASNCFNKSHSVAYGYVTYQTAYLKANFPVEYMSALLSSVSGDRDKVQKYIINALSLGIQVLPPDVNQSGIDFTPVGGNIRFGLAAIKNLGLGAIEAIIEAREQDGKFTSLADFCTRVDSRALNRKGLEALIQAGAMDSINRNRRQLMQDLEVTLEWANRRARESASGQTNLLDLLGADSQTEFTAPTTAPVEDYSPAEKLQLEKELLGFYLSNHPLKEISESAKLLVPTSLRDLHEIHENTNVTGIAMITDIKDITTRKGERMAVMQIEDLTGSGEAVVFPKSYERLKQYLHKDQRLMFWGKTDRREEHMQIIIEDAQPVENLQFIRLELPMEQALNKQELHRLREIIQQNNGGGGEDKCKIPIIAGLQYSEQFVRFGSQFWVRDAERVIQALESAGFRAYTEFVLNKN